MGAEERGNPNGGNAHLSLPMKKPKNPSLKVLGSKSDWLDILDAIYAYCIDLETLASLLEACGHEPIEAKFTRNTGIMITEVLHHIRRLLGDLEHGGYPKGKRQ